MPRPIYKRGDVSPKGNPWAKRLGESPILIIKNALSNWDTKGNIRALPRGEKKGAIKPFLNRIFPKPKLGG